MDYGLVILAVFGVNLLPAFGPPTWAVLVAFRLHADLHPVALVVLGAIAAASGRYALAVGTRRCRRWLPLHRRQQLSALQQRLSARKAGVVAGLALFAVSPVPSAQLFMAAGLLDLPLRGFTAAFFAGRVVSYAGYVTAATLVARSYGDIATESLRSPLAVVVQLALLALVAALPFVRVRRATVHPAPV